MNKRIKELAKTYLSHERFGPYGESTMEDYYEFYPNELEDFVELIVKECLKHAEEVEDLFIELEQESDDSHEKKRHAASAHGAYRVMEVLKSLITG